MPEQNSRKGAPLRRPPIKASRNYLQVGYYTDTFFQTIRPSFNLL